MSFESQVKSVQEVAVRVENVSKVYQGLAKPSRRLKELLLRRVFPAKHGDGFHALRDINLVVRRGETVGIVGRNGSGKSTLLQTICGTLMPTSGSVTVDGRLAALLELGAGFNPEFSGRENVYLNAAILGMARADVDAQFNTIVDFADIGDFIEQPVKNYSSGMFVRLAFAVAIHSDPEILVVDEALSVGDEAFQRKCFARIELIQKKGGTILFVSHSASSVLQLCNHAIFLDRGQLIMEGKPKDVVTQYQRFLNLPADRAWELRQSLIKDSQDDLDATTSTHEDDAVASLSNAVTEEELDRFDPEFRSESQVNYEELGAYIENPVIQNAKGERVNVLTKGKVYKYTYDVVVTADAIDVDAGMMIKSTSGVEISGATSGGDPSQRLRTVAAGKKLTASFTFECKLAPGIYFLNAGVMAKNDDGRSYLHRIMDAVIFRVDSNDVQFGTGFVDLLTVQPELQLRPDS